MLVLSLSLAALALVLHAPIYAALIRAQFPRLWRRLARFGRRPPDELGFRVGDPVITNRHERRAAQAAERRERRAARNLRSSALRSAGDAS